MEENFEVSLAKLANYQQKISRGYNKGIKCREFIPGNLVLRKVLGNTRDPKIGKSWDLIGKGHIG